LKFALGTEQYELLEGTSQSLAGDALIQVRSKLARTSTGSASVIHCNAQSMIACGMSHFAAILVSPGSRTLGDDPETEGQIEGAWLLSSRIACELSFRPGKTQYI